MYRIPCSAHNINFGLQSFRQYSTAGGRQIFLTNPATEERKLFSENADSAETVAAKYQKLRAAQTSAKSDLTDWKSNVKRRKAAIEKFNTLLADRKEQGKITFPQPFWHST